MAEQDALAAPEAAAIARNMAAVQARIAAACARAGRDPQTVRLLAISKTVPAERLRRAVAAGIHAFGENKVQEAKAKAAALADLAVSWSIVGHLQTNKAKDLVGFAAAFQALDSLKVAAALERRLAIADRRLDVLVQVNTSGETSKFGLAPDLVPAFVRELVHFPHLCVHGLMTLAVFSAEAARVRQCFQRLATLRERLRQEAPPGLAFDELSMGMSGDFEIAIEAGATIVRIGQAIFGPRPTPDSAYWPGAAGTG